MPNTRRNGHDDSDSATTTRSRRGGARRRSHTLTAEANRHVIQPARRIMRKGTRRMKRQISTLPAWVPWAAAGVGIAALIYGVSRMEAVQDFISDISDTISDTFGDSDYFDETEEEYGSSNGSADYSSSDYGNADFGSTGAGGL
jgi:hypothetical protein